MGNIQSGIYYGTPNKKHRPCTYDEFELRKKKIHKKKISIYKKNIKI